MFLIKVIREIIQNKKNLQLDTANLKTLQLKKFRQLVKFVNANSPYYQQIINQKKIDIDNCVPEDFPVLDKRTVIDNFDKIVTNRQITDKGIKNFLTKSKNPSDLYLDKYTIIHTSGSSGEIGIYVYEENSLVVAAANSSRFQKPKLFQKMAYIAAVNGHFAGISIVNITKKMYPLYSELLPLDINEPFEDILSKLNEFQPSVLSGYVFGLKQVALAQQKGQINIKPKVISYGGEAINAEDKKFIESVFGVNLINIYASSEFLLIGAGNTQTQDKIMLMSDHIYFEIEDNYTLMTNLNNYIMPLIRYKMNDQLSPTTSPKDSSAGFGYANSLVGRQEMTPFLLNDEGGEDFISFHIINEIYVQNIVRFQMILKSLNNFVILVNYDSKINTDEEKKFINQELFKKMKSILEQKKMNKIQFEIKEQQNLWADPKTGKFKLIVKDY